jgi:methylase of polypeptide subunit release factors
MEVKAQAPTIPSTSTRHRLSLTDTEGIAILRGLFKSAKYSVEGLRDLLGTDFSQGMQILETAVVLRRIPDQGLITSLIRLFALGLPVDPEALGRDLRPLTPERVEAMGLVRLGPEGAEPLVRFYPFASLIVASDRRYDDVAAMPADYVLEINPTTVSLNTVTIRRPVKSSLDVGTGCGILALLAAAHSERVVATDINPRALNFTAFNALLNGLANIECREGSLLEPVAGETFDLIVCNPPYVISPDSSLQFRDSGQAMDNLCRSLVRSIPRHLNEGGFAAILCNWALRPGEDWPAPPTEWVEGSGCDEVIFHTYTESPLAYAATWNRPLGRTRLQPYEAALDRWTDYFRRSGVAAIASGGVVLRRRSGPRHWIVTADVLPGRVMSCSEHILRIIEAQDWLSTGVADSEFLQAAFCPAGDLRLEQSLVARDGRMVPGDVWASLTAGFRFRVEIDPPASRIISLSDGRTRLAEIAQTLLPEFEKGIDEVRKKIVAAAKQLFAMGFLIRVN